MEIAEIIADGMRFVGGVLSFATTFRNSKNNVPPTNPKNVNPNPQPSNNNVAPTKPENVNPVPQPSSSNIPAPNPKNVNPNPQLSSSNVPAPSPENVNPDLVTYNPALEFTNRPRVLANPCEDLVVRDIINPYDIDVDFESIGGLADIKQEVQTLIILPSKNPELLSSSKLLSPPKGLLFYGPPGTGKTMLAKAIASASGLVFINASIANLTHESPGEARKRIIALFNLATKLQPAIIFIDEADSFLGKRRETDHEVTISIKSEFMSQWSGFNTDNKVRVMVLATTNRPEELDTAILRRFSHSFEFSIPTHDERASIFEVTLKRKRGPHNIDYNYLAGLCEGYTGSEISDLCDKAANLAFNQGHRPLAQSDFENVLPTSKPTAISILEYSKRKSEQLMAGLN